MHFTVILINFIIIFPSLSRLGFIDLCCNSFLYILSYSTRFFVFLHRPHKAESYYATTDSALLNCIVQGYCKRKLTSLSLSHSTIQITILVTLLYVRMRVSQIKWKIDICNALQFLWHFTNNKKFWKLCQIYDIKKSSLIAFLVRNKIHEKKIVCDTMINKFKSKINKFIWIDCWITAFYSLNIKTKFNENKFFPFTMKCFFVVDVWTFDVNKKKFELFSLKKMKERKEKI